MPLILIGVCYRGSRMNGKRQQTVLRSPKALYWVKHLQEGD